MQSLKVELTTRRLRLFPLDYAQLQQHLLDPAGLVQALGLRPSAVPMDTELSEAIEREMLPAVSAHPDQAIWYTNWLIVLKDEARVIGGACFKGGPKEHGAVEVGYGIDAPYQGKGYMTEALMELIRWALTQPGVTSVAAETERENVPSIRVLEKVGMSPAGERDNLLYWQLAGREHGM